MKVLIDENIPHMTVDELMQKGYDVKDIRGTKEEGIIDQKLWKIAQAEKRLLITTDKSFSQYRRMKHYGVIIILLNKPNRHKIHQRIMIALNRFKPKEWISRIVIMRDTVMNISR